ncbi:MAG: amidohydrolase family protein [Vicinamibacteraceae bacterium]
MAARLTAFLVAIIVGISVVAGLIVGAQREADPAVDLLVYNGRVYTGDPNAPIAEAVAIRGNRILKIGSNREIKRLRRNAATVIDAHGGSILPGFADTYVTVPGQADAIAGIHRLGLTTVGAVVDDLKALDTLSALATTADRPIRIAAALRVSLPLAAATRQEIDARRAQNATTLVRLDAVAVEVTLPGPKPARATPGRRPVTPPLLPNDQQDALLDLDRAGWPLVLHVDDERELSVALDVVARLIETNTAVATPRRHRVVLAHPMPLDTARLATLGLTVAMPLPATWTGVAVEPAPAAPASADPAVATTLTTDPANPALGVAPASSRAPIADPAILPFSFPLPAGVRLVMGSEIVADPRLGLQALVGGALAPAATAAATGTPSAEPSSEAAKPDAETTPVDRGLVIEALATLTSAAAEALGTRAQSGTLEPGRLADLVVLSADLFELPAAHLLDAVVIATVVDGKVVYDRDTDTPPPTP